MKHGRPQHLFATTGERVMLPDLSWDGAVATEDGWRSEHAARVWQAMQAVMAVACAVKLVIAEPPYWSTQGRMHLLPAWPV